jgi:hypothetical protein
LTLDKSISDRIFRFVGLSGKKTKDILTTEARRAQRRVIYFARRERKDFLRANLQPVGQEKGNMVDMWHMLITGNWFLSAS